LHNHFAAKLEILIFPSDEFGGQELPEDQVCGFVGSHGLPVDAPGCHVMAKVQVNGNHPIWKLAKSAFPGPVEWNFDGIFLFDKAGLPVLRASMGKPPARGWKAAVGAHI